MNMRTRLVCVIAFLLAGTVLFCIFLWRLKTPQLQAVKIPPSNVVFILLDAARADHFSCYGYERNTTPYMDAIARKGVIFLNNFSPATNTYESIPRIFFSRYYTLPVHRKIGWRWGINHENQRSIFMSYDEEQILLTDVLSSHGYRTAIFSDNLDFDRTTYLIRKFDESFLFLKSSDVEDRILSSALSWIESKKGEKLFIYCHIMSPHEPYPAKEEDKEFLKDENTSSAERVRKIHAEKRDLSPEEFRILRGLYDSNLKHTDRWVGWFYDKLEEMGVAGETLTIITSDHGELLGEHNGYGHGRLPWDPLTHVPLIMVYPGSLPSGIRVRGLTESIDIMPTILDVCGARLPDDKSMDGVSLLKFIQSPQLGKEAVFTDKSIRTSGYKYIDGDGSDILLYDLSNDRAENKNIAEEEPGVEAVLADRFNVTMRPYKVRYEKVRRKVAPRYPFFYLVTDFEISPENIFERSYEGRIDIQFLKRNPYDKPWLLNETWWNWGLVRIADKKAPAPITLSGSIPDGGYGISVLLVSSRNISPSAEELAFGYKFSPGIDFCPPAGVTVTERRDPEPGHFYYYLEFGETQVKDETFWVKIDFVPPDDELYFLHHIRFTPDEIDPEETPEELSEEELKRKIEGLKTLGYL